MKKTARKSIFTGMIVCAAAMCLSGCNKQLVDLTYVFDKAIIVMGDEVITVEVDSWTDFDNSDQIQIKTKDGTVYLVHSMNCTLIKSSK